MHGWDHGHADDDEEEHVGHHLGESEYIFGQVGNDHDQIL